ncbi:MAG: YggT family protein [Ktedonobacterales bacterium]|nr:YggT family protein [Ktedonobacterales bacterium]
MSNILHTVISLFFSFLILSFFASMIFSWLPIPPSNPIRHFFDNIVRPIVAPLDRVIPPIGIFRLSFLIAFWALFFAQNLFLSALPANW